MKLAPVHEPACSGRNHRLAIPLVFDDTIGELRDKLKLIKRINIQKQAEELIDLFE